MFTKLHEKTFTKSILQRWFSLRGGLPFKVKVGNEAGSVISQSALLNVYTTASAPAIIIRPSTMTMSAGSPPAISVTAIGSDLIADSFHLHTFPDTPSWRIRDMFHG